MLEDTLLANKYRIKKLLGSGGVGEVYLAQRDDLGGEVAIKVIRSDIPQASLAKEAKILAGLQHPNICQFIDFTESHNSSFIVMEYLNGIDLSHFLRHGTFNRKIDTQLIYFIFKSTLEALSYAHEEKNILHRDIKPANIFITKHLQIKLLDFGISRSTQDLQNTITSSQFTPLYASPDLFNDKGDYLPRSYQKHHDFFSLALVIFELFALQKAYKSFEEVRQGKIDLSLIDARSPELSPILRRMLTIDNVSKYNSAKEILDELKTAIGERFYTKPNEVLLNDFLQTSPQEKTIFVHEKPAKRSKRFFISIMSLLVLSGLVSWGSFHRNTLQPTEATITEPVGPIETRFEKEVDFSLIDEEFSFSSSLFQIKIGLGELNKWIIPSKGLNCIGLDGGQTCRFSIKRKENLEVLFVISDGKIRRISFTADKGADEELKEVVDKFLKVAENLPDEIFSGVDFKTAKLKDQKLNYQLFPLVTIAILELQSKNK